jgi:cytochrome c553
VILAVVALMVLATPGAGLAHEPHECVSLPDAPLMSGHIEQADIVAGHFRFDELVELGELLFAGVFNHCDGQGRPATTGGGAKRVADEPAFIRTSAPDASSCAGCHAQPRVGGGGDFVANVFVLAQTLDPVTESVNAMFSNERNTLGMFGSGPIEMLGREMTAGLLAIRDEASARAVASGQAVTAPLHSKGIEFGHITALPDGTFDTSGVRGVDPDLIIKPFHQAGAVRSIREFTVNAMNHHHGMQAEERFDLNPDKGVDFDEDGILRELTIGDITAATLFQAQLAVPGRVMPADREARAAVADGERLFSQIGCASCHTPALHLESRIFTEPYALNPAGTFADTSASFAFDMTKDGEKPNLERAPGGGAIVRAFTDLKRHDLCDDAGSPDAIRYFCNEQLAQGRPDQDGKPGTEFFVTRKLWDVGNSAPYGHRGDLTTISEAILVHGGEARASRDAFVALAAPQQAAVVSFLKTLQVLPEGSGRVITAGVSTGGQPNFLVLVPPVLLLAGIAAGWARKVKTVRPH